MKDSPKCSRCGTSLPSDVPEGLCPRCLLALNLATETDIPAQGPHGTHVVKPPPQPPPPVEEIARLFPELEILESLGRGGMGLVYKARQRRLNRLVALKLLSRERMGDAQFADRFEREAQALASLNHPNIVAVYEFGQVDGNPFFIMEYVDGLNLRELEKAGKLSPRQAMQIIPQICEALQYAHDEGIVHRDIKPENILLDKKGRVKIADFGIAKILGRTAPDRNLTQVAQVVGTPHYMAPEQVETPQAVDHRADIYSLGVVFYEMLTGELPLGKFQPPSRKVQIDVRLDDVVLHALEKEPERRYQHAKQVKTDLETIATSKQEPASAPSASEGTPQITASRPSRSVGKLGWAGRILGLLSFLFVMMFITAEGFPPFWNQPPAVQVELISMLVMLTGLLVGWRSPFWGAFLILDGWLTFAVAELRWPPVPFTIFLVVAALYVWTWWKKRQAVRPVLLQGQDAINEAEWRDPRNWTGPKVLSVYFSKRDTRTWVPKQIPSFGWTVNLGTPRGCAWLFGILLAITLFAATLPHWIPQPSSQAPVRAAVPPATPGTNVSQSLKPIPSEAPVLVEVIKRLGEQIARAAQSNDIPARVQFEKEHSARMKELQESLKGTIAEQPINEQLARLKDMAEAARAGHHEKLKALLDEINSKGIDLDKLLNTGASAGTISTNFESQINRVKLQQAEAELAATEQRFAQGLVDIGEYQKARLNRDIAGAELRGDKVAVARLRLQFMEQELARYQQRFNEGLVGKLDMDRMKANRDIAALQYAEALSKLNPQLQPISSIPNTNELPQLRFLAWQDENPTQQNWRAWHPDGTPVKEEHELGLLSRLGATKVDVSSTAQAKENPRFLHLWFSHPEFDQASHKSVRLFTKGAPLPLAAGGSIGAGARSPEADYDNQGWIFYTLSPGNLGQTPTTVSIHFAYSIGQWSVGSEIEPGFRGSMSLGGGAYLNGFGQGADGKAFVPIVVDVIRDQSTQYDFLAITKEGRTLASTGLAVGGASDGPVQTMRFEFPVPLNSIRAFRLRTRPILKMEITNVSLERGHITAPQSQQR